MESGGGINSDDLVPELTKLRKDENIKAVVLRVNSPGGSAYASEQIWAELEAIKAAGKKLIVSMSDMAASGGYYISCGADRIFAENTTLTGSIGVFGTMPVAKELVQDKLGLRFDGAFTHEGGNPFSSEALYCGINENQAMAIQRSIENTYDLFTRRCAEGRGMSQDDIKKIAEGRVWIGKTAAEIGLVDEIGSIEDAIAYAAQACELEDYKVANYPAVKSKFEKLMENFGNMTRANIAAWVLGEDIEYLKALKEIENVKGVQARMDNITIE
jgi:protease-4